MSLALRYHEATKYAPETIGNHSGLDWERQPLPFKEYHSDGRIEFAELPKTVSGKIRRVALRGAEMERGATADRHPAEFWEEDFPELK